MAEERVQTPRRGRFLVGLAVLGLFVGTAAAAISIFQVGVLTGFSIAGGCLAVYVVPAAICGWPLPSLHDVLALVAGIFGAIVTGILSIFD